MKCGYGEALGEAGVAHEGIAAITWERGWQEACQAYRMMIFGKGAQPKAYGQRAVSEQQMQKVMKAGGKLPRAVLLRCRVRYFSDGALLGSKDFVRSVFESHRDHFGKRRRRVGRALRGAHWEGLEGLRDLRGPIIT